LDGTKKRFVKFRLASELSEHWGTERNTMRRAYSIPASALRSSSEWNSVLATSSGLGFDTLLLSLSSRNIFADRISADLDLAKLVALANDRSLQIIIDVPVSSVPAMSPAARMLGLAESGMGARDPRIRPAERQNLPIPFSDQAKALTWVKALRRRLLELEELGIAGFCCRPESDTPEWIFPILAGGEGQSGATDTILRLWASLARLDAVPRLASAGFAGAFLAATNLFDGWRLARFAEASRVFGEIVISLDGPPPGGPKIQDHNQVTVQKRSKFLLWASAALGDGILVPMGFEYGIEGRLARPVGAAKSWCELAAERPFDLSEDIAAANAFVAKSELFKPLAAAPLWPAGAGEILAAVRRSDDKTGIRVVLANPGMDRDISLPASTVSREVGEFLPLKDALRPAPNLVPENILTVRAGDVRILEGRRAAVIRSSEAPVPADGAVSAPRLVIEAVSPCVDGGRHAVKRIVGDAVHIECDAYGEGHDPIAAALLWRASDETLWREKRMTALGNDRWAADLPLERIGRYLFSIEAWRDEFAIYRIELQKKHEAGLPVALELKEGEAILSHALGRAGGEAAARLDSVAERLKAADDPGRLAILLAAETAEIYAAADSRAFRIRLNAPILIDSERRTAEFASWYELFPRSQSGDPNRHGTFDDVARRLPAIRDMGFDVVYFPPIHPIGKTNRKGRNNALKAGPDDPGSPYAIGSGDGGHDAIHPALGTFEDFQGLLSEARKLDLEIALDFAIQASPDHPWLKQHPDWFSWRPDGTIRYAENPPKKYEDIVNFDFYAERATPSLWVALRDTIRFWVDQGVLLFRVDNPHTKPFPFWDWVIDDIRRGHPEVVFLAEAFTRPKVMYRLAKAGFSQSYTYFTWRNTKRELTSYLTELTSEPLTGFFRPHFFVNTPDINPDFLQNAPRPAFLIRAALAATLSGLWGIYNGFELCEGKPDPQRKEYLNSEKYEIRAWDWDRPGNIIGEVTSLNRIRRENPALHSHLGLSFLNAWNENVLFFEKATADRQNVVLVAISLDPGAAQEADVEIPLWKFGLSDHDALRAEDLIHERELVWSGKYQRIRLDPELPFAIWRVA
jgi:starch synthase (maltosyl-transferring)